MRYRRCRREDRGDAAVRLLLFMLTAFPAASWAGPIRTVPSSSASSAGFQAPPVVATPAVVVISGAASGQDPSALLRLHGLGSRLPGTPAPRREAPAFAPEMPTSRDAARLSAPPSVRELVKERAGAERVQGVSSIEDEGVDDSDPAPEPGWYRIKAALRARPAVLAGELDNLFDGAPLARETLPVFVAGEPRRLPEIDVARWDPSPRVGALRPPVEWWTVGARRYDSTEELLEAPDASLDGRKATYHFRLSPKTVHAGHFLLSAADAALAGGAVGALAGGVLALLASLGDLMTMALYGHPDTNYELIVAVPSLIAASIGAFFSVRDMLGYRREGETIPGRLRLRPAGTGKRLTFVTDQGSVVGVRRHAGAAPVNVQPASMAWYDALAGIAAAAVMTIAIVVPLGPAIAGVTAILFLAAGTNVRATIGGAALGYGASYLAYLALTALPGLQAAVLICAAGGLLGVALMPRARKSLALGRELGASRPWWAQESPR